MRGRAAAAAFMTVVVLSTTGSMGSATSPAGAQAPTTDAGDPVPAVERHVRRLLYDLQNDGDPTAGTVAVGVDIFDDATPSQASSVVTAMQTVPEGRGATVDDLFSDLLRRDADPSARQFFMTRLARIGRLKVAADLAASGEYYVGQGGGTNGGWVDAVYRDLLGRAADAGGRQYFIDELAHGQTRGTIASRISGGNEGRRRLVKRLMLELLRRPADPGAVTYFADRLAAGWRVERVVTAIVTSAEYRTNARAEPLNEAFVVLGDGSELSYYSSWNGLHRRMDITGLAVGEQVLDIDVRPSSGVLYGITSQSRLVAIATDGTADAVGGPIPEAMPDGLEIGIDFAGDVLEVATGNVLAQVDPDTATTISWEELTYSAGDRHDGAMPDVHALGHRNPGPGAPIGPARAALDTTTDSLAVLPESEGTGELATVGPLHIDIGATNGLDVSEIPSRGRRMFAVLDTANVGPAFYRIELTGEPRLITEVAEDEVLGMTLLIEEVPDETAYAVTAGQAPLIRLISTRTFETVGGPHFLTGLDVGTTLIGLDVRPSGGALHGIGSNGQIYVIALTPQLATLTKLGAPLPSWDGPDAADNVGFDVDPVADQLRVTNGDQSYRVRLADGAVVGDGATSGTPGTLTYSNGTPPGAPPGNPAPDVLGVAYTNSQRFIGTPTITPATTTAYGIDQTGRTLVRLGLDGAVEWFGLQFLDGYEVESVAGFDISPHAGQTAWAMVTSTGGQALVSYDLVTGNAYYRGTLNDVPGDYPYTAFAVA